jgi:glycerol-3-phosphate dehydrogenase (NAD(P)+)
MAKISVIGAGAWGTTLAILAAENGHSVTIWSYEEDVATSINELRENKKYLNGFQLPSNIDSTNDIIKAAANEILVIATPSQYLRKTLKSLSKQ